IMYFMVIRPQQKKTKEHQELLNKLKKNDEVMTSGGIYGKVMALAENVVTFEVAPNVRIRVHRPQISAVVTGEKSSSKEAKEYRNATWCCSSIDVVYRSGLGVTDILGADIR